MDREIDHDLGGWPISDVRPQALDLQYKARRFPCRGDVSVWLGDQLLARTSNALKTSQVEANGQILIPKCDIEDAVALDDLEGGLVRSHANEERQNADFIMFDPNRVRIVINDRWAAGDAGGTINRFPRWGDMLDLLRLMDVDAKGGGLFSAPSYSDVRRNVVEGGQLLGSSIVAAARSVPDKRVVSAHIVLSRPAAFDKPLELQVATHRLGRSFATLGVNSTQDGKPIASSLILLDRGAPDVFKGQVEMPEVPGPEDAEPFDFGVIGRDSRFVNGDYSQDPNHIGPPELHCWIRHREAPSELCLRQALFVQSMSHFTIAAAMLPHSGFGEAIAHRSLSTGVLTVNVAFHEDPDITDWHLYSNPAIHAGHGLAQGEGRVFARDGRLIASYSTQAMIRNYDQSAGEIGLDSTRIM